VDARGYKLSVDVCELNKNVLRANLKEYERVFCPNISQKVQQFIPGLRSCDRKRMLSKVGDYEAKGAAFLTPQWTRGDKNVTSMMHKATDCLEHH